METKPEEKKNEQVAVTPVIGSPKFIPILFSTEMVTAILARQKTQTRRKKKLEKLTDHYFQSLVYHAYGIFTFVLNGNYTPSEDDVIKIDAPYKAGDILWVRETFQKSINPNEFCYKADTDNPIYLDKSWKWKPSLFMPKEACRIFLLVKSVRVERLQDISRGDAIGEGCPFPNIAKETNPVAWFAALWQKINGFKSWNDNPFVWVIEFERIERPTGFL